MRTRPSVPRRPWRDRRIVLGVTGGVAAYKAVQLARDLTLLGARVDPVLTGAARRFVQPLSFEAVTGRPVPEGMFEAPDAALHVRLAREADLVLVAPATADFLARSAHGRSDDLLTALLLATSAPVMVAPAMNDGMYAHPQTRRNLDHLAEVLDYRVAGPGVGPLAHGEGEGPGRMLEPEELVEHAGRALEPDPFLRGRRVLVTSGPTREPLDPVRSLTNRSTGRMGDALARAAWRRGGAVTLVTGPTGLARPPGVDVVRVETAREMLEAVREVRPSADLAIFAAAVSDFRPRAPEEGKMKRNERKGGWALELEENPDVAGETRDRAPDGQVTVAFALETDDLVENARRKLESRGFDMVVANPAGDPEAGFESERNRAVILRPQADPVEIPLMPKDELAEEILDRVPRPAGGVAP